MAILIQNFDANAKVPAFYGQVKFGASPISLTSIPITLLLVGLIGTGFTTGIKPDQDVVQLTSVADADTWANAGSELACMAYSAFGALGGSTDAKIMACAPSPNGSAAAAACTITFTGTSTSSGTITVYIDGRAYPVTIASGVTAANAAIAVKNFILNDSRVSLLASSASTITTLTDKSAGARGNQAVVFIDISAMPSGLTAALAGGAAVTSSNTVLGVLLTGGSGIETLTTLHTTLAPNRYSLVAIAQNDSTSLGLWLAQTIAKALPGAAGTEHVVFGSNDTLSNMTSLCQTTLNYPRYQGVWQLSSETRPCRLAAANAAIRLSTEQANPNAGYDRVVISGNCANGAPVVAPQRFGADRPTNTTLNSAINNGITALATNSQSAVSIVRAVTTHTLSGTLADYRTLDTNQCTMPDWILDDLNVAWSTFYVVQNPYVQPDPVEGKNPASKVATPTGWDNFVKPRLLSYQNDPTKQWLTQVRQNPPVSYYDNTLAAIVSTVPVIPTPIQHSIGVLVLQQNVA